MSYTTDVFGYIQSVSVYTLNVYSYTANVLVISYTPTICKHTQLCVAIHAKVCMATQSCVMANVLQKAGCLCYSYVTDDPLFEYSMCMELEGLLLQVPDVDMTLDSVR